MSSEQNDEKKWNVLPPLNLPGAFLMELETNQDDDLKEHRDDLDNEYKFIYEDPLNFIDILAELDSLEETDESGQLFKKENVIDKKYYLKKNERSEVFLRYAQKEELSKIFNYGAFIEKSFTTVEEEDEDVVESYPLFLSNEDRFSMIIGEDVTFANYENEDTNAVVNKIIIQGRPYNLTKQNVDKYICISVKSGSAYYSAMESIHKLSKL